MALLVTILIIILNLMGFSAMNELEVTNKKLLDFENEINILKNIFLKKNDNTKVDGSSGYSYHITLLLAVYFGWCGLDRFYIGKVGTGILKLITFGGFGLWWLIDVIFILLNKRTDVDGKNLLDSDKKETTILCLLSLNGILSYLYLGFYGLALIKVGLIIFSLIFYSFNIPFIGSFLLFIYSIWAIVDIYLAISGRFSSDINGVVINNKGEKSQSITLILVLIGGFLALDRFYLGYRTLGILKLFSFGGFGLWVIVDFILIITNSLKDAEGKPMVQG